MRLLFAAILLPLILTSRAQSDKSGISDLSDFFGALNLDYPGLEKVKAAVQAGNPDTAKHEFAKHLRHREKPAWKAGWFPSHTKSAEYVIE